MKITISQRKRADIMPDMMGLFLRISIMRRMEVCMQRCWKTGI